MLDKDGIHAQLELLHLKAIILENEIKATSREEEKFSFWDIRTTYQNYPFFFNNIKRKAGIDKALFLVEDNTPAENNVVNMVLNLSSSLCIEIFKRGCCCCYCCIR